MAKDILVVDDNEDVARITARLLTAKGYSVTCPEPHTRIAF